MKTNIQKTLAAVLAATAAATFAVEGAYELEPVDRDPGGWRISVGVRTAPGVKTKAGVDSAAAVRAAGRVQMPSAPPSRAPAGGTGTSSRTTVETGDETGSSDRSTSSSSKTDTSTNDGGTTKSGTTKDSALADSGYDASKTRYEFDNGYIDEDVTGPSGTTANWHFDDASAFDGNGLTVSGAKNYSETAVSTRTDVKTTTVAETETVRTTRTKTTGEKTVSTRSFLSGGGVSTSLSENVFNGLSDVSDKSADGFDLRLSRSLWESSGFGIDLDVGWTFYRDIDCFGIAGRAYEGRATAKRSGTERTVETTVSEKKTTTTETETISTTTTKTTTETTETKTTETTSGSVVTVLHEPELTDLDDIRNPDGSIGGASYDGQPVQPGWTTAFLTVTPDRFSVEDRPNETSSETSSSTTTDVSSETAGGTPETKSKSSDSKSSETSRSSSRTAGATRTNVRTVDVRSTGNLSLQELRLGISPFWKATDWLRVKTDFGLLGSYAEIETRTSVYANGTPVASIRNDNDEWNLQGYAGLSLAVIPVDWLEIAAGAEARFPSRKIRFDDGIVSGSTELAKWDAFVSVGIRF